MKPSKPYYQDNHNTIHCLDFRKNELPDESVQCVVTSPPYWSLRKYSGEQDLIWEGDKKWSVSNVENQQGKGGGGSDLPLSVGGAGGNLGCGCKSIGRVGQREDLQEDSGRQERQSRQQKNGYHCQHEWSEENILRKGHPGDKSTLVGPQTATIAKEAVNQGSFCSLCGAWRGQLGLEPTMELYIQHLIEIMREIKRVLRKDGVVFWNIKDTYFSNPSNQQGHGFGKSGVGARGAFDNIGRQKRVSTNGILKPKDLCLIPQRLMIAAQKDGWWVRSVITICKRNPMPESVRDRPINATELVLMLTKNARYFWDSEAVRVGSDIGEGIYTLPEDIIKTSNNARSLTFTAKSSNITGDDQLTPYLILSSLFAFKGILVKERDNLFSQMLRILQPPQYLRIGRLASLLRVESSAQILVDILQDLGIISPQDNIQSQSEFITSIVDTEVNIKTPLAVKETSEVIPKLITNAKALRDTLSLNELTEGRININMVNKTVPFPNCFDFLPQALGNGIITSAILKHLALSDSEFFRYLASIKVRHNQDKYTTTQTICQGHNIRNYWLLNTQPFPAAHFAVFPEKLPELCIKAATPEVGCCSKCGAPWTRVIKKGFTEHTGETKSQYPKGTTAKKLAMLRQAAREHGGEYQNTSETLGWQPTCTCQADKVPSLVLDPLMGAGTTLLVAKKLNRRCVGYELSEEYCELAVERNRQQVLG